VPVVGCPVSSIYTLVRELGEISDPDIDLYDVSADEKKIILMDVSYLEPPVVVRATNWPELLRD